MKNYRSIAFALPLLAVAICYAPTSHAQTGIYGLWGGARLEGPNVGAATGPGASGSFTAYGETFGIYHDFGYAGPIGLGLDIRGVYASSSNSAGYDNKLAGGFVNFRTDFKPITAPLRLYAQAGIGPVTTNDGRYPSSSGSAGTAYQVQLGVDFTILPDLDLRGEYAVGQVLGSGSPLGSVNLDLQQYSAGLVLRF